MSAQGWAPGNLLGNGNSSYKEHLTAASSGHIRVILKDDNLGLGAKPKSKREDEPTGLDAFQDLLGRLNGKSDTEIKTDQRKREDVKLLGYVGRRWGTMRFVRGGMLVQDEMPESSEVEEAAKESAKEESKKEKKKRRKEREDTSDETDKSKKKDKKKKKSKDRKAESESDESDKSKKRKRKDKGSKSEKSQSEEESEPTVEAVKPSTVAVVMAERRPMGRHVIRGRNIMQKKRALMDDKSLNEVGAEFVSF